MGRSYHVRARLLIAIACVFALLFGSAGVVLAQPHPSASSAPTPSASGSAGATGAAEVKVRDKVVFTVRAPRGGRTPQERAKAAQSAIDAVLANPEHNAEVVSWQEEAEQGVAIVYIGKTPVLTLGAEDAQAGGEASVAVLAAQVSTRLADAVSSERKRSAIATTAFSVSLLVFSALIAFWLLGRAAEVAEKLRSWMADNPDRLAAVRLGKIELVSAGATRGGTSIALTLGYRLSGIL